jgi:putative hydrolase of the HAD superfamily
MKKSGIYDFFETIITSESVGVKKPNKKVFEYALEKVNANAFDCIMIGDNLEADIEGALNCGIKSIHFNPEHATNIPKNITSIHNLLDLKEYL